MNELAERFQHCFRKRLPKRIANLLRVTASGDQIIVAIGGENHAFVSNTKVCQGAFDFLQAIRRINDEADILDFAKVYPRHFTYLESLCA